MCIDTELTKERETNAPKTPAAWFADPFRSLIDPRFRLEPEVVADGRQGKNLVWKKLLVSIEHEAKHADGGNRSAASPETTPGEQHADGQICSPPLQHPERANRARVGVVSSKEERNDSPRLAGSVRRPRVGFGSVAKVATSGSACKGSGSYDV